MQFDNIVPCYNKSSGTNTCQYILLHHTWGGDYSWNLKILSWQTSRKVSCHYLVGIDGKVAKIGKDTDIQRHAGSGYWDGKNNMNNYAIGIEVINVGTNFTHIQREKVRELINYLMWLHKIQTLNILRHKDVSPWRKVDIYDTFRNNEYQTFTDYQNSFIPKEVTEALDWNSNLRHTTTNNDLKKQLNDTNTMIRKIYNIKP